MPNRERTKLTTYVVVCSDYHKAVGPITDPDTAIRVARQLTGLGGCVYFPVPMEMEGVLISEAEIQPKIEGKEWEPPPGQYL